MTSHPWPHHGRLSGPPLKGLALAALRTMRSLLTATVPPLGCGDVSSGADALEFVHAGSASVQLYTVFGYECAGAARAITDEMVELLRKEGMTWREGRMPVGRTAQLP